MATQITHVRKACAYVTRGNGDLLVFRGPEHDGLQIPKGTIEAGEDSQSALFREVREESGLSTLEEPRHLASDVWTRRHDPPKRYVRHFFHATVHEPREEWTHVVTGEGAERGLEYDFTWLDPASISGREFALELDDYVHLL